MPELVVNNINIVVGTAAQAPPAGDPSSVRNEKAIDAALVRQIKGAGRGIDRHFLFIKLEGGLPLPRGEICAGVFTVIAAGCNSKILPTGFTRVPARQIGYSQDCQVEMDEDPGALPKNSNRVKKIVERGARQRFLSRGGWTGTWADLAGVIHEEELLMARRP